MKIQIQRVNTNVIKNLKQKPTKKKSSKRGDYVNDGRKIFYNHSEYVKC